MTRLGSLILCAALGSSAALCGCGGGASGGTGGTAGTGGTGGAAGSTGASSALDLVPKSNEIVGWTFDTSNSKTANGAATATTQLNTEALIDGASADFFAAPNTPVLFAWETYVNTTFSSADVSPTDPQFPNGATMDLKILQMPNATQAAGLYASLTSASLYVGKTWTEPSSPLVGTDSRITDTGDHWWINFYKGDFYVEVSMGPSYSPPPSYTPGNAVTKAAEFAFASVVAGKI